MSPAMREIGAWGALICVIAIVLGGIDLLVIIRRANRSVRERKP